MSRSLPEASLLVPLACPRCGGNLDPLREDILFLCPACGAGSELAGSKSIVREVRHASPSAPTRLIHLPFWRLSAAALAPAFNGSRLLTLCRAYSDRVAAVEAQSGGPAPRGLWGGRIGADDARRVHALAEERAVAGSRRARVHGGPRSLEDYQASAGPVPTPRIATAAEDPAEPPVLFAVPFLREPSRLVCALTGLHIYLETLEGASELIARWDELDTKGGDRG